jgi:hypothetical protein
MAAAGPPLFGGLIMAAEYPAAWALCGLFPLAAVPLVPTREMVNFAQRDRKPGVRAKVAQ